MCMSKYSQEHEGNEHRVLMASCDFVMILDWDFLMCLSFKILEQSMTDLWAELTASVRGQGLVLCIWKGRVCFSFFAKILKVDVDSKGFVWEWMINANFDGPKFEAVLIHMDMEAPFKSFGNFWAVLEFSKKFWSNYLQNHVIFRGNFPFWTKNILKLCKNFDRSAQNCLNIFSLTYPKFHLRAHLLTYLLT